MTLRCPAVTVCKIGGTESDDPLFLKSLAQSIALAQTPTVVIHGGGKDISALQELMGIPVEQIQGLRVTSAAVLPLLDMVLCGLVNKRVVRSFLAEGLRCLGLSGSDDNLLVAERLAHLPENAGFIGKVTKVNTSLILCLIDQGITPILAPVAVNSDNSHVWNINADHAAVAVGLSLQAKRLEFLTNVPGVLQDKSIIKTLSLTEAEKLIENGVISGGMIPKVRSALAAVAAGIPEVVIRNAQSTGTLFFNEKRT